MRLPSVLQKIEQCPHGCGAAITYAKKAGRCQSGKYIVVYHTCKKCWKKYVVRYPQPEKTAKQEPEVIINPGKLKT